MKYIVIAVFLIALDWIAGTFILKYMDPIGFAQTHPYFVLTVTSLLLVLIYKYEKIIVIRIKKRLKKR